MKLPNGFGQITKLNKANLRYPCMAMITVGHNKNGRPISKLLKSIAYFKTYNYAYYAFMEQNKNPYDNSKDITLNQLLNDWKEFNFNDYSASRLHQLELGYRCLSELYGINVKNI